MSIFQNTMYLDPKYDYLQKYVHVMYRGLWTPTKYEKLIREVDAPQYFNEMTDMDRSLIKRCILAVSMVEDKVKTYWPSTAFDFPHTIISDIVGLFGQSEVTHRISYHSLAKVLKIDTNEVNSHLVLKDRLTYLQKHLEKDSKIIGKKRILKKLVLFTSLIEKGSLFTQFYILMKYGKAQKGLTTISSLQQSTAIEENVHYSFGIDLVNIIKKEEPQVWDDYLVDLVTKNIDMAYKAELKMIDWFFEAGVPDHLSKAEVVNFLNYNFSTITRDLQLDKTYPFDEAMYRAENEWFTVKTKTSVTPDFFDTAVGSYASEDEELNIDEFKF